MCVNQFVEKFVLVIFLLLFISPIQAQESTKTYSVGESFDIFNDGTVVDHRTGLMWQMCGYGQEWNDFDCKGRATPFKWEGAVTASEIDVFAGYDDWYIPNSEELLSLIEPGLVEPVINTDAFPGIPMATFWSSTRYMGEEHLRIVINYLHKLKINEGPNSIFDYNYLRLVRRLTDDSVINADLIKK